MEQYHVIMISGKNFEPLPPLIDVMVDANIILNDGAVPIRGGQRESVAG